MLPSFNPSSCTLYARVSLLPARIFLKLVFRPNTSASDADVGLSSVGLARLLAAAFASSSVVVVLDVEMDVTEVMAAVRIDERDSEKEVVEWPERTDPSSRRDM